MLAAGLLGGWGGLVPGVLVLPELRFSGPEVASLVLGAGWGTLQGLGWAAVADASERQSNGAFLLGSGLGLLGAGVVSQVSEASGGTVATAYTSGLDLLVGSMGLAPMADAAGDEVLATGLLGGWAGGSGGRCCSTSSCPSGPATGGC